MREAFFQAAALIGSPVALGWLAVAMEPHWRQVRGTQNLPRPQALLLRALGALGLAATLALCFAANEPSMAPLVWILSLSGGALVVAFILAWRPRLLAPLVAWVRS